MKTQMYAPCYAATLVAVVVKLAKQEVGKSSVKSNQIHVGVG